MRERRQIVQLSRREGAAILVTLVSVSGSSYRQAGARMLLGLQGSSAGTISGGCLEAHILRKAGWLARSGATVERYSTELDELAEIPFGLGCGGVVDILIEPGDTPEYRAILTALEDSLAGNEATVFTWLPKEDSRLARAVLSSEGEVLFFSEGLPEQMLDRARSYVLDTSTDLPDGVFVERLTAPLQLFVLGAGDDAKPLVNIAALLGWRVIVLDGRANLARTERFPGAERVGVISAASAEVSMIGRRDAVVLMTHSYEQDRDLLAAVLPLKPQYLGLLGSRQRSSLLIAEAAAQLKWPLADCCECVHAPVGLNLGGEGPEAIALAIIAEVQACCMGNLGSTRKLSPLDVENYNKEGNASRYLQAQCALDLA